MSWAGLCTGKPGTSLRMVPAWGRSGAAPAPLATFLVQAGREAELPRLPRRPSPELGAAIEICPSRFNIGVPAPGGSAGPPLYAAHADRQTAAGKRPSITAPFSLSPPEKGDERR